MGLTQWKYYAFVKTAESVKTSEFFIALKPQKTGAREMAQWVNAPAATPDPKTHLLRAVSQPTQKLTHINNKYKSFQVVYLHLKILRKPISEFIEISFNLQFSNIF